MYGHQPNTPCKSSLVKNPQISPVSWNSRPQLFLLEATQYSMASEQQHAAMQARAAAQRLAEFCALGSLAASATVCHADAH
jgi:hypothetical protein